MCLNVAASPRTLLNLVSCSFPFFPLAVLGGIYSCVGTMALCFTKLHLLAKLPMLALHTALLQAVL